MGLPIPRESIGKVIPQLLEQLPLSDRVDIHRKVTKHLMKKYIQVVGPLETGEYTHEIKNIESTFVTQLISDLDDTFANAHILVGKNAEEACKMYQFLSHRLSSSLVAFLTKFDIFYLLVGVFITVQVCTAILLFLKYVNHNSVERNILHRLLAYR